MRLEKKTHRKQRKGKQNSKREWLERGGEKSSKNEKEKYEDSVTAERDQVKKKKTTVESDYDL